MCVYSQMKSLGRGERWCGGRGGGGGGGGWRKCVCACICACVLVSCQPLVLTYQLHVQCKDIIVSLREREWGGVGG